MRRLIVALALLVVSCGSPVGQVSAPLNITVSTVSDCSADAAPDIAAAIAAVQLAGGAVTLPAGCYLLQTPIFDYVGLSVGGGSASWSLLGEGSATVLVPNVGSANDALRLNLSGSVSQIIEIGNFVIAGPDLLTCPRVYPTYPACSAPTAAAKSALRIEGTLARVHLHDVQTYGLYTVEAPIELTSGSFSVERIGFYATVAPSRGLLDLDAVHDALVEDVTAVDYGTLNFPYGAGPGIKWVLGSFATTALWVRPRQGGLDGNDRTLELVQVNRLFCDEGTLYCVLAYSPLGYRGGSIRLAGLVVNQNATTSSRGIWVQNYDDLELERSFFGYVNATRTAVELRNVGDSYLSQVRTEVAPSATLLNADAACGVLEVRECDLTVTSSAAKTIIQSGGTTTCTPGPC